MDAAHPDVGGGAAGWSAAHARLLNTLRGECQRRVVRIASDSSHQPDAPHRHQSRSADRSAKQRRLALNQCKHWHGHAELHSEWSACRFEHQRHFRPHQRQRHRRTRHLSEYGVCHRERPDEQRGLQKDHFTSESRHWPNRPRMVDGARGCQRGESDLQRGLSSQSEGA